MADWRLLIGFLILVAYSVSAQQFVFPDDVRLSSTVQPQRSQDRLDIDALVFSSNQPQFSNSLDQQTSISR